MAKVKITATDDELIELRELIEDWVSRIEKIIEKAEEEKTEGQAEPD